MSFIRKHMARMLLATATLAVLSVYGYYYGLELLAKWAFAHQTYFSDEELVLIAVPKTDLSPRNNYLVNAGEFEWEGEMVDVLHREIRSDTLFIYGFRDAAETELKEEAAWLYTNSAQPYRQSDTRTKPIKWVSLLNPASQSVFHNLPPLPLPPTRVFFAYRFPHVSLPWLEVPYPPPNT